MHYLKKDNVSILIPTYNGRHLLEIFLRSTLETVKKDSNNHEIIVIDNGSIDNSVQYIKNHYPEIKIVKLKENKMLANALNTGLKVAKNDIIIIIINNDMCIDKKFIPSLIKHFKSQKIFAVSSKIMHLDRCTIEGGIRQGLVLFGFFEAFGTRAKNELDIGQIDFISPVLVVENGAFNKRILLDLGGLDPLFPLWATFTDICYRAWKKGYYMIFEPTSIVYHRGASTTGRPEFRKKFKFLQYKENFLFMWKNFTDLNLIIEHILFLPIWLILHLFFGEHPLIYLKAFLLPIHFLFKSIAWLFGFVKSHTDGYGHIDF